MSEKNLSLTKAYIKSVLGQEIGRGNHRIVYNHLNNIEVVIKKNFKLYKGVNCNEVEFKVWKNIQSSKFEKFFCPVEDVTPCFSYLIMAKARPLTSSIKTLPLQHLPKELQCDLHRRENWGILNSNIVVVDYGFSTNLAYTQ